MVQWDFLLYSLSVQLFSWNAFFFFLPPLVNGYIGKQGNKYLNQNCLKRVYILENNLFRVKKCWIQNAADVEVLHTTGIGSFFTATKLSWNWCHNRRTGKQKYSRPHHFVTLKKTPVCFIRILCAQPTQSSTLLWSGRNSFSHAFQNFFRRRS